MRGKLGKDLTTKQGYDAARLAAGAAFSVIKQEIGDLSKIKNIIYVDTYINSTQKFHDLTKVNNGFCDALVEVLGDKGRTPRMTLGVTSLPMNKALILK